MWSKFHAENSICAPAVCSYVASMNWQQLLPIVIVLGVAVVFVWRSSSKKHEHNCNCGCAHDHEAGQPKEKAPAERS
jgi:hypothetical protein